MKKSEPFQEQLLSLAGDNLWAEPTLWFLSVIFGIIACKTIYNVMKASSPLYSVTYMKLSKAEKIEWDNSAVDNLLRLYHVSIGRGRTLRGFSTVHAIVVSATAVYLLFFGDFFKDDSPYGPMVFRSSIFSQVILGVSIGYFISDLAMILWVYPALGGKEYVLHHLLSMTSLALSLYSGQGHFYIYLVLLSEITTPLVNLRWYLSMAGMKNSKAYVFNGILLFYGWLIARVLLFVYFFIHIYLHYDQVKEVFTAGFYFMHIAAPSLALMNLFWFYKLAKGLLRMLSKRD